MLGSKGEELAQRAWSSMWRGRVVANLAAGGLVLGYFLIWLAPEDVDGREWLPFVVVFCGYVAVFLPIAWWSARRRFAPVVRWVEEGRAPDDAELATTMAEPWRQAAWSFVCWMGGCAIFAVAYYTFDPSVPRAAVLVVGAALGGLNVSALVFLLAERSLRPVFRLALAGGRPSRRSLGVGRRLLATWVLGAGVPLFGVGVALVWREVAEDADIVGPLWALITTGILAGLLVFYHASRSVSDPLIGVRDGLQRVKEGDLLVEVPVDDASEIGLLQVGFNAMVSAVRDRQRLQELLVRHVGAEVARQAVEREVDFEGEQREASVLFVDLIGSTTLAETRAPHEVMATLNALFAAVVRVVTAEGGWVNKFEGDAALCVFGVPGDEPDHAARALRAAIALRSELFALATRYPGIDAGIGVATGGVVAGNLGAAQRYEFTVVGRPVNQAARLSDASKERPARVLASEAAVLGASGTAGPWALSGSLKIRGSLETVAVYEPGFADSTGLGATAGLELRHERATR